MKKEYKDFIKDIIILINKLDINTDLTRQKCFKIYKLYNNIEEQISNTNIININELNNILLNNKDNDDDIILLKKFINIKNLYILKKILNSKIWKPFIIKLINIINIDNDTKNIILLEKAVYRLLMKYINHFNGCWEIAKFNNNKVKKIDIIEPEHIEFIHNYINNYINNQII
jgi:hypothetical protein